MIHKNSWSHHTAMVILDRRAENFVAVGKEAVAGQPILHEECWHEHRDAGR
jgi:hypothetical protein